LATALKDTEERFLDEVYRIMSGFDGLYALDGGDQLRGPGMQGWLGFIPVPIRIGHEVIDSDWQDSSWLQNKYQEDATKITGESELQVAGLPDRSPPVTDWAKFAAPSAGILMHPKTDYSAGYVPVGGPDYSTCTRERSYIRAFDAAFYNSGSAEDVVGQPFTTIQIDGIYLGDFAYSAPGPGNTVSGISVMVKVPGLTTWMDAGRPDGAGPGKQDPALDGAGCRVNCEYTFDSYRQETGLPYCQVAVNVGPLAVLQPNPDGTVPILVKVIMQDAASYDTGNYDLNHEYDSGAWTVNEGPGISSAKVRGILGIKVIRESEKTGG